MDTPRIPNHQAKPTIHNYILFFTNMYDVFPASYRASVTSWMFLKSRFQAVEWQTFIVCLCMFPFAGESLSGDLTACSAVHESC